MGTRRWVPAGAGVLLVIGVLAARGGSAAAEEDLLPPAERPEPSAAPTATTDEDRLVVEANGVTGARLGSAGAEVDLWGPVAADGSPAPTPAARDLPGGCVPGWTDQVGSGEPSYSTSVWVVDGLVSSVTVSRWDAPSTVSDDVATWLGPTLGSPVEAASELPGARTAVERPFGADGPAVTVVHVPADGVDVVFSDAVSQMPAPASAQGRIATIEVRHPRARQCSYEALLSAGSGFFGEAAVPDLGEGLGRDGLPPVRIGSPAASLAGVQGLVEEGSGTGGCRSWAGTTPLGGWLRVVAVDDVVAQVMVNGEVATTLPVAMGDGVEDVEAAYPQLDETYRDQSMTSLEVPDGDRVVTVEMWQDERWVRDVDVAVTGGPPVVRSLAVRDAAVEAARLC